MSKRAYEAQMYTHWQYSYEDSIYLSKNFFSTKVAA